MHFFLEIDGLFSGRYWSWSTSDRSSDLASSFRVQTSGDEVDNDIRAEERLPCSQSHGDSPPHGELRDLMEIGPRYLGHGDAPTAVYGSMDGGEVGTRRSKKAASKAQRVKFKTGAVSQSVSNAEEAELASGWLDSTSQRGDERASRQGGSSEGGAGPGHTYDLNPHDTDRQCSPSDAAGTSHVLHLNCLRGGRGEVDVTILPNHRSHSSALSRVVKADGDCVPHSSSREGSGAAAAEGGSGGAFTDPRPTFQPSQRVPGSGGPNRSGGQRDRQRQRVRLQSSGGEGGGVGRKSVDGGGMEAGEQVYSPSEGGKRLSEELDAMQSQAVASEDSGYSSDAKEM